MSARQNTQASLPTDDETAQYHLRGFEAGCARYQDNEPMHEIVRPALRPNNKTYNTLDKAGVVAGM